MGNTVAHQAGADYAYGSNGHLRLLKESTSFFEKKEAKKLLLL
jgi:hypothetical protein